MPGSVFPENLGDPMPTKPSKTPALDEASAWWQSLDALEKIAVFDELYNKTPSAFFKENEILLSAAEDDDILIDSLKSAAEADRDDLEEKIQEWKNTEDFATEILDMLGLGPKQILQIKASSVRERSLFHCLKGTI